MQNQQQGWGQPAYNPYGVSGRARPETMDMSTDPGLRAFMLGIYNWMAAGLAISGVVAWLAFQASISATPTGLPRVPGVGYLTEFGALLYVSPLKWVIVLAPLGMIFGYSFLRERMSASAASVFYLVFTGLMGLGLAAIFFRYQLGSITQVFFMTGAAFGAMSLWGYTTKRDLTGFGTFLIMALFGLIIASIVNLIWPSGPFAFVISVAGVLIFAGLTAWDTQRLKESYYEQMDLGEQQKISVDGAMSLYLNFINMFQMLLSLFGMRNED